MFCKSPPQSQSGIQNAHRERLDPQRRGPRPRRCPRPRPAVAPAATAGFSAPALDLNKRITEQGNRVRTLKEQKADKAAVQAEVQSLLALKAEFKKEAGKDWTPNLIQESSAAPAPAPAAAAGFSATALDLNKKITEQGNKVRTLKEQKADKAAVQAEVQTLLSLKAEFKKEAGKDWSPNLIPEKAASAPAPAAAPAATAGFSAAALDLNKKITEQGNKVRTLKEQKADKAAVQAEVQSLLALKAEFKKEAGKDWAPNLIQEQPSATPAPAMGGGKEQALAAEVAKQGDLVRDLKTKKADKATIDAAVKTLLELKAKYQAETGKAYAPPSQPRDSKPKEQAKPKEAKPKEAKPKEAKPKEKKAKEASPKPASDEAGSATGLKKVTRLGLEAKKDSDLPEWYSQVITKSEMIEYYDISGCYILRPWSFAIWELIREFLSQKIKALGVKDCSFPMFVSKSALEREKTHIADFAPEVAWVTHSGSSELGEHIAVRPTSETVMYPAYAKWVQSHRDLPLKLNQWNSVVRWEFKQPQPFLRTREFLWQEGHTAYMHQQEAVDEVHTILDYYAQVYEHLLAIPVIKGRKTEKEKFAGGDFTTTVEGYIPASGRAIQVVRSKVSGSGAVIKGRKTEKEQFAGGDFTTTVEGYIPASGRAIQGATSHHLGQNFSKMFEIIYDDPDTQEKKYVFQNSWGITTRTIGVMVLVHGDDRGLVLPPRVAAAQAVVVPCGVTASSTPQERQTLLDACKQLVDELVAAGIRAEGDYRDNYSPGWKFNHWELKGVPVRVELGPKDLAAGTILAVRRLTGEKLTLQRASAPADVAALLERTHDEMLARATAERDARLSLVTQWEQFTEALERKHMLLAPFCGEIPCEDNIKNDSARTEDDQTTDVRAPSMGAKSLCIPFKQPRDLTAADKCIHPACAIKPKFFTLFGRSY
ncbi:unnamed protein product [Plutella xylostella]|uniref:proline--tRNA ligase n=1 Tax=Plutella xylostella TaxID=51655 RepID=A0A8S4DUR3_PLUXY|nr:unnamed protein product [Plutella xylostella]